MPEHLTWVREHMPKESAQALAKYLTINTAYRGAGWDDILDILLDADAHLDITEPLYDFSYGNELRDMGMLPAAVAITLLYASQAFAEDTHANQAIMVKATIANNGGPEVAHGHVNVVEDMIIGLEAQVQSVTEQADMWRGELVELNDSDRGQWDEGTLQREKDKVARRIEGLEGDHGRLTKRINALQYLVKQVAQ